MGICLSIRLCVCVGGWFAVLQGFTLIQFPCDYPTLTDASWTGLNWVGPLALLNSTGISNQSPDCLHCPDRAAFLNRELLSGASLQTDRASETGSDTAMFMSFTAALSNYSVVLDWEKREWWWLGGQEVCVSVYFLQKAKEMGGGGGQLKDIWLTSWPGMWWTAGCEERMKSND